MRRRHRRVLFNLFAFALLGIAVYLNIYRMHDADTASNKNSTTKSIVKTVTKTSSLGTMAAKETRQN